MFVIITVEDEEEDEVVEEEEEEEEKLVEVVEGSWLGSWLGSWTPPPNITVEVKAEEEKASTFW